MFSVTDAAFSGFRAAREHPRALLVWAVAFTLYLLLITAIVVAMGGAAIAPFIELAMQPNPDQAQVAEVTAKLAPLFLTVTPLLWLLTAFIQSVVCRVVLRPDDGRSAFLRLGRDEVLQLAVVVLTYFILFSLNTVVSAVGSIFGGGIGFIFSVLGLCLFAVASVKLSLANAITFDTGRIGIVASWRVTKGRFWPMLGAYAFAIVLSVIVFVAVTAIFSAVSYLIPGLKPEQAADMSSVSAYFTPLQIVSAPFAGAIATLTSLIIYCPAVEIYRQLKAAGATPTAS